VLAELRPSVSVGGIEALLENRPEPGVTLLSGTGEPLVLRHTPQLPNLWPWQVTEVTEVDSEGLCSWTSGELGVECLLLSLGELLCCSSPLSRCQLWLGVTTSCPRSGPS
jgi:hypothetical protein